MQENIVFHSHLQAKAQKELLIKISSIESTQQMLLIKEKEKENELVLIKEHNMEVKAFAQETSAKHHLLEEKISLFENQVSRLLKESKSQTKTINSNKENNDISRLTEELSLLNRQFCDLNLRQLLFENSSFDGKLVWKVDNVTSRMQQAISGQITALHSAPAYTHQHGYKFCARLYLNGDGLGKKNMFLYFLLS